MFLHLNPILLLFRGYGCVFTFVFSAFILLEDTLFLHLYSLLLLFRGYINVFLHLYSLLLYF